MLLTRYWLCHCTLIPINLTHLQPVRENYFSIKWFYSIVLYLKLTFRIKFLTHLPLCTTDIATYIIDIGGIGRENYIDYSQSTFNDEMNKIDEIISTILKMKNVAWDFKSMR